MRRDGHVLGVLLLVIATVFGSATLAWGQPYRFERTDQVGSISVRTTLVIDDRLGLTAAGAADTLTKVDATTEVSGPASPTRLCARAAVWLLDDSSRDVARYVSPESCVPATGGTSRSSWRFTIRASDRSTISKVSVLHGTDRQVFRLREMNHGAAGRLAQPLPRFITKGSRDTLSARWNVWMRDFGRQDRDPASVATVGQDYTFVIDLAAISYPRPDVTTTREVSTELSAALGQNSFRLSAKPVLLGRGLSFRRSRDRNEADVLTATVDVQKLRAEVPEKRDDQTFADWTWQAQAARFEVSVTADAPGCAAIALSIWDTKFSKPLDVVVHWVRVAGASPAAGPVSPCATDRVTDRSLVSHLLAAWQRGDGVQADAGLHIFESSQGNAKPYAAAVMATAGNQPRVFAWPLVEPASPVLSQSVFLARLNAARDPRTGSYDRVGDDLRRVLFRAEGNDQTEPTEALKALEAMTRTPGKTIVASLVTSSGYNYYYPLGLLRVGNRFLGDTAVLLQPLPRQTLASQRQCISTWTSVIPANLGDTTLDTYLRPSPRPRVPGLIDDQEAFETYAQDGSAPGKSEGFLLLAHHAEGHIWFGKKADAIRDRDVHRQFAAGSVAVLAACKAGDPKAESANDLLTHLNRQGIDAAIVSPFDVPLQIGIGLAWHFGDQVNRVLSRPGGGTAADSPTLAELFDRATKALAADPRYTRLIQPGTRHEWVLVGDPGIRICPPGPGR